MKNIFPIFLTTFIFLSPCNGYSQAKTTKKMKDNILVEEFRNTLYNYLYNYSINSSKRLATFSILKININTNSKVTDIVFSDSADSLFAKSYLTKERYNKGKTAFELYAKKNKFKNLSVMVPIIYEPDFSAKQSFSNDALFYLMNFNKEKFIGKTVFLSAILVRTLSEHNI